MATTDDHQGLLGHVLVPVDHEEDARKTSQQLQRYGPDLVTAVYVAETGEGRPDVVPAEAEKDRGEAAVDAVQQAFPDVDEHVASAKDVPECIFEIADDVGATAIAYRPLADSRLMRVLSEDISRKLVTQSDRPVVVLSRDEHGD